MMCRKVRRLIPLLAGNDLPARKTRAVLAHVDSCEGCRAELEGFRAALAAITAAAKAEVPDWSASEWDRLMTRVKSMGRTGAGAGASGRGVRVWRPSWAAAAVLGGFLGLVVLGLLVRSPGRQAPHAGGPSLVADKAPQDRVVLTMVSPESGLQIVWFLDKNFNYEGERK